MARLFGIRVAVILGFAVVVVIVQILAVSRLGSYSQEFYEEQKNLHVMSRRPTTSLDHEKHTQHENVAEQHEQTLGQVAQETKKPVSERERPSNKQQLTNSDKTPSAVYTTVDKQTTSPPATAQAEPSRHRPAPVFCEITSGDAMSAINRASTSQCKNLIRNVTCLVQEGKLYNMDIPNLCTLGKDPGVTVETLPLTTTSIVDKPVRLLFLLSLHGRSIRQVRRLFKAIYHQDHYYYVHVDSRSDYLHREVKQLLKYPNVAMTSWRLATIWGGASLLQMLLRTIRDMDQKSEWEWDFFINLSESDYPVQPIDRLVAFLSANKEKNFVKTHGRDVNRFIQKQGLDRTFVECDDHMWRVGTRPLPERVTIDGGSDWIVINRRYSNYLVTGKDDLLVRVKRIFEFSLLPAEAFFHTILRNGDHCNTFVRSNLRITNWKRKLGCRCQYKHIVDWCGCSPNDFLSRDLGWLKSPGDYHFFARKFEAIVNQDIITLLDAHLYGPLPDDTPSLHGYWESIYHTMDDITMPTDAQYTAYMSLHRITTKRFNNISSCVPPSNLQEVSVYQQADTFNGLVVTMGEAISMYEAFFTSIDHVIHVGGQDEATKRLIHIQVSSVWDEKESMFRNYAGFVGPNDDIVLAMRWALGIAVEMRCEWYDPTGELVSSHRTKVEPHLLVSFHKPTLNKPVRPGVWTVKVLVAGRITMETSFLVIPSTHNHKKLLDRPEAVNAAKMTDTHHNSISDKTFDQWRNGVVLSGSLLLDWVDELVSEFWTLKSLCAPVECNSLPHCKLSSKWSTLYPDPKSELNDVQNGRLR